MRDGITTTEREQMKALERENKELGRANEILRDFVYQHRQAYGVEPICKVLQIAPSGYWRHAAHQHNPQQRSARVQRDDTLAPHIERVWHANMRVYGAVKVWKQLNREGMPIARWTG